MYISKIILNCTDNTISVAHQHFSQDPTAGIICVVDVLGVNYSSYTVMHIFSLGGVNVIVTFFSGPLN